MQKDSKLFDDMAKMASGATGMFFDMKRELETAMAARFEALVSKTNFVTREEFEAVREMAANARAETQALKKQVEALAKPKAASKKPAASKAKKPTAAKAEKSNKK